ncbi:MAG: DUF1295 domain-containing protein [Patescibacteria group bacterium]|nr:DUF1295 domain-containing protein [Patescibacteria group bacterium]
MITLLYLIAAVALYETVIFGLSLLLKRQDIADVFWGPTFIYITIVLFFFGPKLSLTALIVNALVLLWGTRLAIHIGKRFIGKKEDKRYRELSKNWGKLYYPRSFLQTFLLQGFLALLVSVPVIILNLTKVTLSPTIIIIGATIWLFGFLFEIIADKQLADFVNDPKSKGIMQSGLWRYSRHPNYFGEVTLWWGIFVISLTSLNYWYYSIIGPLTITFLILFVSGIPMLEKRYGGDKEYEEYKRKTSIFLPLPPKE